MTNRCASGLWAIAYPLMLLTCLSLGCGSDPSTPEPSAAPMPDSAAATHDAPSIKPEPPPRPTAPLWPTYHGPASLCGYADVSIADTLEPRWRAELGAEVSKTPVADNERIYAANSNGEIHALDFSGKPIWTRALTETLVEGKPPSAASIDAPLALFESTLIACSSGGTVFALDPATGETRWESNAHVPLLGSPNLAILDTSEANPRRLLLIDQAQGSLHALDFDTGKPIWKSKGIARCDGSPAATAEVVIFGSCNAALHFFSTKDGSLVREVDMGTDCEIAGGVALSGDSAYSGSRCGKFVQVNVRTGAIVWENTECEGEAMETPAVSESSVAFTANDGCVYLLERASGKLKWRTKLEDTPSSPVLVRNKVVVSADGKLHVLALEDGRVLWSYEVSDEISSPAIVGELVVVGCDDGSVAAFGSKGA
ncbi:MAG: PQQ-binding-like beta-propeller repeat protein [Candidatus Hydrogenedentes bacterium]|nr:PQQ-binding-like beta-propeller repeat protein [Candidatus Hydrogenedentota bacterium]